MPNGKALLVGIERYANPAHNLPGLSLDIRAMVATLSNFGVTDLEVLRDHNATSRNITEGLNALVDNAGAGDVRIFYFTGHGVRLPPGLSGPSDEEADGRDQAFVPFEGTTDSLILDDWMADFLKVKLPNDTFFYGLYDCCHSGQMYKTLQLPGLDSEELPKEIDFSRLAFRGGLPQTIRNPKTPAGTFKVFAFNPDDELRNSVHIGASEPEKTALVLNIDGVKRSAFTWALEQTARPGITIENLERALTQKQAEKTRHHSPQVATNSSNHSRQFFR